MSVALLTAVVVGGLLAAEHSSTKPTVRTIPAADRSASPALLRAAAAVGFKPTSEPGAGGVEAKPLPSPLPASAANALPPGTTAPAFDLRTPTGQRVSLASLRGKTVLLELFATWCPHCAAEAPHLKKLYGSLPHARYGFVSVNADGEDAASILAFHIWFELPYPALLDPNPSDPGTFHHEGSPGPVSKAYRIKLFPTFYVIDPHGRVAWAAEGEQPDALLLHELRAAARA
jgi:peroxiredoxin